jgi:transcriptional regulator with XRE-family HTH domain
MLLAYPMVNQNLTSLGPNIRAARAAAGVKQAELARRIGVTPTTVWKWENARVVPPLERIAQIADVLGVTLDALVKLEAA